MILDGRNQKIEGLIWNDKWQIVVCYCNTNIQILWEMMQLQGNVMIDNMIWYHNQIFVNTDFELHKSYYTIKLEKLI